MHISDKISLAGGEQFAVGSSSMASYIDSPERLANGAIIICRSGSARLTVDVRDFSLCEGSEMVILPGKIVSAESVSENFVVDFLLFSRNMFEEASYRMDLAFFKFLSNNPFWQHNEQTIERFDRWMASVQRTCDDREHMFRDTILRNLLQNVFLTIYDSLRRCNMSLVEEHTGRQGELFHKYVTLVNEHFRKQHNVAFYAAQMFITTRYLSAIVRSVSGESPKDIIDRMIVLEMKVLLRSTGMSIQEIATQLHFPDQSYMGRYFRKHTGMSPSEYRNKF